MTAAIVFRPLPWFREQLDTDLAKPNQTMNQTDLLHFYVSEFNRLSEENKTLRKDVEAFKSAASAVMERHPSTSNGVNDDGSHSIKIRCEPQDDWVTGEQCVKCIRERMVPMCPKVRKMGGS